jgi:uncharacterized membrane protein
MSVSQESARDANDEPAMPKKILGLLMLGFLMAFVGIMILMVATAFYGQGSASFGVVVFIGPIPIVVGAGPQATWIVLFAIILAALSVIMYLMMRKGAVNRNF